LINKSDIDNVLAPDAERAGTVVDQVTKSRAKLIHIDGLSEEYVRSRLL
jgi:hypothetical protein